MVRVAQFSVEVVTVLVGGVVAIITAFVTGLWPFLTGKKKSDLDAQASLVNGFVALLAEFKSERELLVKRINDLEENNQRQDRHILRLERLMSQHNIRIPGEK